MNIAFTQYGLVKASEGAFPERNNAASGHLGGPVTNGPSSASAVCGKQNWKVGRWMPTTWKNARS
jgi:hypothetical protein